MDRRDFLGALAAGLTLPTVLPQSPDPRPKHWAWMKAEIRDVDAWRRELAALKAAGFDAVLMTGTADSYGRHAPLVRRKDSNCTRGCSR